jgi:ubiquinone/menaquinone biosynthesis C-methylase UbiE
VTAEPAPLDAGRLREAVRARYAAAATVVEGGGEAVRVEAALRDADRATGVAAGPAASCCSGGCGCAPDAAPPQAALYSDAETALLPAAAVLASLGCGNPTALIDLRPGEVVLDLGSGGGIDVLLSARRVGPSGFAYGVDMTDEMLALAERNAAEQGAANVSFLKGTIEDLPLPDGSVDVVISNCVINLSADKGRVLREAHRVLRPGGRFAVSDVVVQGDLPEHVRRDTELWAGCVAGALDEGEYRRLLIAAGFTGVEVEVTRDLNRERGFETPTGRVVSAFVRATRPGAA